MPESAEVRRAVNSETPKSLKERAVSQSSSGGFSSQGWVFQWGMSQEPGEHGAGDAGVDAFVPVGEAVVAEEREEDDGGEEHGERGGDRVGAWMSLSACSEAMGKTIRDLSAEIRDYGIEAGR